MQEDKILKELLIKAAVERASPGFTERVMNRIGALNADKVYNSLIINKRWKLIYKIAFLVILFSVIIMSFLVKSAELPFAAYLKVSVINEQISFKIIVYILSFWILIFINQLMGNKNRHKLLS